jgi:hypothetical protein
MDKKQTSFPSVGNGLDFSRYAVVPSKWQESVVITKQLFLLHTMYN